MKAWWSSFIVEYAKFKKICKTGVEIAMMASWLLIGHLFLTTKKHGITIRVIIVIHSILRIVMCWKVVSAALNAFNLVLEPWLNTWQS